MSSPSDPQAAALLDHVISQMEANVQFLVSQNYITAADASTIRDRLPNSASQLAPQAARSLSLTSPAKPPTGPRPVQARALWAYNENGQDADDLSFSAGDIIEIVAETNDDWWMGKVNGKQALFPSSYVEKITTSAPAPAARSLPPMYSSAQASSKPAYKPFMAAHHGADAPPPGGVNSVGLQQDVTGQEKKKSKFGKYGNTMAQSAAGGVGFGAGAAIGGGLVRAIF